MTSSLDNGISVFGLGYVGSVSAVCLASQGHRVYGVDVNEGKLAALREGRSPVIEERIGDLTQQVVAAGQLTVTRDAELAIRHSKVSLICVGTPSSPNGSLSTTFLEQVTRDIGSALAKIDQWHTVVFRSTMLPGTCETILVPLLERYSGKQVGIDFGVCVNPEYLREGSSVADYFDPPKIVVGAGDERSHKAAMALYGGLPGPRYSVPIKIAEMTKYVDNSYHALKVSFANEIGAICSALGLDSHEVMQIFLADTKLNLSGAYLKPGFAFGGSCLPKDVRALTHLARKNEVDVPILANLLNSNNSHLSRALEMATSQGSRKIGIFGLSFKQGTDDLRESPMVELVERLIGKGFDVRIHDEYVHLSRLTGANYSYIKEKLPHIDSLLDENPETVAEHAELLIVGTRAPDVLRVLNRVAPQKPLIDLVRLPDADVRRQESSTYTGIAW